eukprot:40994_1
MTDTDSDGDYYLCCSGFDIYGNVTLTNAAETKVHKLTTITDDHKHNLKELKHAEEDTNNTYDMSEPEKEEEKNIQINRDEDLEQKTQNIKSMYATTLNEQQIIIVLNEYICNRLKYNVLMKHRDEIISYVTKESINGSQLFEINEDKLTNDIATKCCNNDTNTEFRNLFKKLLKELKEFDGRIYDESILYPSYIHKAIWNQSDDERLESLIDESVRKVQQFDIWMSVDWINKLYDEKTYDQFVENVYDIVGGDNFFNEYIKTHYRREIAMWKQIEQNDIDLVEEDSIKIVLITLFDFRHRDLNKDGELDFFEFQQFFVDFGYTAPTRKIRKIFDEIDQTKEGTITRDKYDVWKQSTTASYFSAKIDDLKPNKCSVYYNTDSNMYEFYEEDTANNIRRGLQKITTVSVGHQNNVKWAMYVNELAKTEKSMFAANGFKYTPNGFWEILCDDCKDDMIPIQHLKLIHQLLNYYYISVIDQQHISNGTDNTPLMRLCQDSNMLDNVNEIKDCNNEQIVYLSRFVCNVLQMPPKYEERCALSFKQSKIDGKSLIKRGISHANAIQNKIKNFDVTKHKNERFKTYKIHFSIHGNVYKLCWWNIKAKSETNAISIVKSNELQCFVNNEEHSISSSSLNELQTKTIHVDNNSKETAIRYLRFISDFNMVKWEKYSAEQSQFMLFDDSDHNKVVQLEATFLSNIKQNFPADVFNEKFNNCLLTNMAEDNIDCSFQMIHSETNHPLNTMQLMYFNHLTKTYSPQSVRRLFDDQNSLYFSYSGNEFIQTWKSQYMLFSKNQQMYFFAFVVSIVTMMKYIDIELSNQPIVMPTYSKTGGQNFVKKLMGSQEVNNERMISKEFKGSIIPPTIIWTSPDKQDLSLHASTDKHEFVPYQSEFLRLAEAIRKYTLEFDSGRTIKCLWPWWSNSFHCDERKWKDTQNYDELVCINDLANMWTMDDINRCLPNTDHDTNMINTQNSQSIRLKRKVAARFLLNPQIIAKNVNLLRNQLKPLLIDIMDNIMKASKLDSVDKQQQHLIIEYCKKMQISWPQMILNVNTEISKSGLLYENIEHLKVLDIDRINLPIFQDFMNFFFIKHKHSNKHEANNWYKVFLDEWIKVPTWYNDDHDVLLLELILRNGLQFDKILDDLQGENMIQYKIRLGCNEGNVSNDPYYEFLRWCNDINILHRLKYVMNVILKNLAEPKYGGGLSLISIIMPEEHKVDRPSDNISGLLFNNYQKNVHCQYIDSANTVVEYDEEKENAPDENSRGLAKAAAANYKFLQNAWTSVKHDSSFIKWIRKNQSLRESTRKGVHVFQAGIISDTIKYGIFKRPRNNYNPFVRLSLIRESINDYKQDTDDKDVSMFEFKQTLPIWNGGSDVRFRKCDKNTFTFSLRGEEYCTVWLTFDVLDQNILTNSELLFGSATIQLHLLKEAGQLYYTQLPLQSGNITMNITGVLHVTAIKKLTGENIEDIFNENKNKIYNLELEILAVTNLTKLKYNHVPIPEIKNAVDAANHRRNAMYATSLSDKRRARIPDPFIQRNIDNELLQILQSVNLETFCKPLAKLIIHAIQQQNRDGLWKCFGLLMNAAPDQLALSAITDSEIKMVLKNTAKPEVLNTICLQLMAGSLFQTISALGISGFFDDLADMDCIKEAIWTQYSEKYEIMAYDEMSRVVSCHLLFVLLNIPLTQHDGKSLLKLALQQNRIVFLNNDGITQCVNHSYQGKFLAPEDKIVEEMSYKEMLELVCSHPFEFYFSVRGYYWVSGMLFMLYFGFICYYVSTRPIDGHLSTQTDLALEIALWSMNLGYILFELQEFAEKKWTRYIYSGNANLLDIAISIIWIILFVLRMIIIDRKPFFEYDNPSNMQRIYVFGLGSQVILLTFRSLELFSSSESLGVLVKAVKFMALPITKILFIFVLAMTGFLFGLWVITATHECAYDPNGESCSDYQMFTLWDGLIYVFQVFIGSGDLSGVGESSTENPFAVFIMVIATIFGTIILTNLLIALMTTQYENVQEKARSQIIYDKAELTYDLSSRSRLLPPPLNIVVFIIAIIIDIINFFLALISPTKLNIYTKIHPHLFFNLKHYNLWRCRYDLWKPVHAITSKYKTRVDILKWYFIAWWYDWIKIDGKYSWRIHHKSCYAELVIQNGTFRMFQGFEMSEYCRRYEDVRRQKIRSKDKKLLKQLSPDTLFCKYCVRPYSKANSNFKDELTTPFIGLLDIISAITFIILPIAWIPIILLFAIFAFQEHCFGQKKK